MNICLRHADKRILVVEDQEDNRQIIRDMLTFTDYEIMEAESGEQALEAVAKQRPDLILMDIQLPGMDGYETTRRIKADPALKSITIIAVTSDALNGEEQKARAEAHPANKFSVSLHAIQVCDCHTLPHQLLVDTRQWTMSNPVREGNMASRLQYPKSLSQCALLIGHVKQRASHAIWTSWTAPTGRNRRRCARPRRSGSRTRLQS